MRFGVRLLLSLSLLGSACDDGNHNALMNHHLPDSGSGVCGSAMCAAGELCCGGTSCTNPTTDLANCGGCGIACPAGRADTCTDGACKCGSGEPCGPAQSCCGGACVDLTSDSQNCGSCGHPCDPGQGCSSSTCVSTTCNGQPCAFLCCGGTTCADLSSDPANCGMCGHACRVDIGEQCRPSGSGGLASCVAVCGAVTCQPGWGCCQNSCTDLPNDVNNCGSCGHVCPNPNGFAFCINGCCDDGSGNCFFPDGGLCLPGGAPCFDGTLCCSGICPAGTCAFTADAATTAPPVDAGAR